VSAAAVLVDPVAAHEVAAAYRQHSVLWTTDRYAEPKAVLLDPRILRRSQAAALGSRNPARARSRSRLRLPLRP
jgi:hypothetical protein